MSSDKDDREVLQPMIEMCIYPLKLESPPESMWLMGSWIHLRSGSY